MKYINRIRDLREDHDMTQQSVAEALGTSQTMYARYERGANELPWHHLLTLCRLYGVSEVSVRITYSDFLTCRQEMEKSKRTDQDGRFFYYVKDILNICKPKITSLRLFAAFVLLVFCRGGAGDVKENTVEC